MVKPFGKKIAYNLRFVKKNSNILAYEIEWAILYLHIIINVKFSGRSADIKICRQTHAIFPWIRIYV